MITGGGGFIGANLIKQLRKEKIIVHVIVKKSSDLWRIKNDIPHISLHYVPLTNIKKLTTLFRTIQPSYIFHLATHGAYPVQNNVAKMLHVNIQGTLNLLEASKDTNYKLFVHTGTSSEYGYKHKPMKESDILEPTSFYAATKASATLLGTVFATMYRKPIVTLRLFSVYGPFEEKTRFIPTIIDAVIKKETILLTPGKQRRDFIYIDDVIAVFLRLIKKKSITPGIIYNVGTGVEHTNDQVVQTLFSISRKKSPIEKGTYPPRLWDTPYWKADISKITSDLKWAPKYTLDAGLKKTYSWWNTYYGTKE